MPAESMRVTRSVTLPLSEIELRFSRSSGPGGQHAQRTEIAGRGRARPRDDDRAHPGAAQARDRKAGPVIRAVAQDERSQWRNRELAVERLVDALREALKVERPRRPTRRPPPRASGGSSRNAARARRSGCAGPRRKEGVRTAEIVAQASLTFHEPSPRPEGASADATAPLPRPLRLRPGDPVPGRRVRPAPHAHRIPGRPEPALAGRPSRRLGSRPAGERRNRAHDRLLVAHRGDTGPRTAPTRSTLRTASTTSTSSSGTPGCTGWRSC